MAEFLSEREAFDIAYNSVLRDALARAQRGVPAGEEANGNEEDDDEPDLQALLGDHLPEALRETVLESLAEALELARESELQQILEAGDMVTLPLKSATNDEVEQQIAGFEAFLWRLGTHMDAGHLGSKPVAVTIARSVVDGFCPMRWLCSLERGVLMVLERFLGGLDVVYSDELDALENR